MWGGFGGWASLPRISPYLEDLRLPVDKHLPISPHISPISPFLEDLRLPVDKHLHAEGAVKHILGANLRGVRR